MRIYPKDFFKGRLKGGKAIKYLNAALGLLLVLSVLLAARDVASFYLAPKEKPRKEARTTEAAQPVKKKAFGDYAPILKNNPFGAQAGELRELTGASAKGEGAAAIDITLIGTVAGSKRFSYAIFSDKAGKQEVFGVGDSVFGIGALKEVFKDKVVLDAGGTTIDIELADVTKIELQKSSAAASTGFATKTGETSFTIDQQRVQQAIDNPKQIMTDARLLPNMVGGQQQGFSITEVKPAGIFASLGLQNGDVLLRINEFEVSSPEAALQAFTALRGFDRIQLDIQRGGQKMALTYMIK